MTPVRVAFYETEAWQEQYLQARLPVAVDARFCAEPLHPCNLDREAEGISVFVHSPVRAAQLHEMRQLQWIATRSTGFDHVDLEACSRRGIAVSYVPHYGENTVAEHTFALILALSRKIHPARLRTEKMDFSLEGLRGFDLKGKTLGVVGAGSIGLHVVRIARGFDMQVLAFDARPHPLLAEVLGFRYVSLETLLAESDIVSLHVPALPTTHHLLNRERFASMKRGALLINTGRGSLVDTGALLEALDSGHLRGAGLDVLEGEEALTEENRLHQPEGLIALNHRLVARDDVIVTPHMAFYSEEAERRILDTTLENIHGFVAGAPVNVVSLRQPSV